MLLLKFAVEQGQHSLIFVKYCKGSSKRYCSALCLIALLGQRKAVSTSLELFAVRAVSEFLRPDFSAGLM
jgi:hypothetical protein